MSVKNLVLNTKQATIDYFNFLFLILKIISVVLL